MVASAHGLFCQCFDFYAFVGAFELILDKKAAGNLVTIKTHRKNLTKSL